MPGPSRSSGSHSRARCSSSEPRHRDWSRCSHYQSQPGYDAVSLRQLAPPLYIIYYNDLRYFCRFLPSSAYSAYIFQKNRSRLAPALIRGIFRRARCYQHRAAISICGMAGDTRHSRFADCVTPPPFRRGSCRSGHRKPGPSRSPGTHTRARSTSAEPRHRERSRCPHHQSQPGYTRSYRQHPQLSNTYRNVRYGRYRQPCSG